MLTKAKIILASMNDARSTQDAIGAFEKGHLVIDFVVDGEFGAFGHDDVAEIADVALVRSKRQGIALVILRAFWSSLGAAVQLVVRVEMGTGGLASFTEIAHLVHVESVLTGGQTHANGFDFTFVSGTLLSETNDASDTRSTILLTDSEGVTGTIRDRVFVDDAGQEVTGGSGVSRHVEKSFGERETTIHVIDDDNQ